MKQYPDAWVQTYSGTKFYPLEPDPEDIHLIDIAHSLAHQCRFTGHCDRFYSVAEHSFYVSKHCSPENALWGLLHDATEAYLADIARPIKMLMPEYKEIEKRLEGAIALKFNLPLEIPAEVKEIDLRILGDEQAKFMLNSPEPWQFLGKKLGVDFDCARPFLYWRDRFMNRCEDLIKIKNYFSLLD
jgi:uncharacterized protein